jgi:hypothetical protein
MIELPRRIEYYTEWVSGFDGRVMNVSEWEPLERSHQKVLGLPLRVGQVNSLIRRQR